MVAREIRSRDDAGPFGQLGKFFGSGLERNPDRSRFERDNGEHLPADLEQKVVAPLDLLGRVRQGDAEFTDGIGSHERIVFILAEGSGSVLDFTFRSIHRRIGLESTYS